MWQNSHITRLVKSALRCVPVPTPLWILYLDTRQSPTVAVMTLQGNDGGNGMTTIEKTQLLLICSFLLHPVHNSQTFPFVRRSANRTSYHITNRCQPEVISGPSILPLLTEADGRSGAANILKSSAQSFCLTRVCSLLCPSFFQHLSCPCWRTTPKCLFSFAFSQFSSLCSWQTSGAGIGASLLHRMDQRLREVYQMLELGLNWGRCDQKAYALSTATWGSSYGCLYQQLIVHFWII